MRTIIVSVMILGIGSTGRFGVREQFAFTVINYNSATIVGYSRLQKITILSAEQAHATLYQINFIFFPLADAIRVGSQD